MTEYYRRIFSIENSVLNKEAEKKKCNNRQLSYLKTICLEKMMIMKYTGKVWNFRVKMDFILSSRAGSSKHFKQSQTLLQTDIGICVSLNDLYIF